jgi:hypothetical protein
MLFNWLVTGQVVSSNPAAVRRPKQHTMPCHRALAEALHAYIDAGIAQDRKGWLFCTARGHAALCCPKTR